MWVRSSEDRAFLILLRSQRAARWRLAVGVSGLGIRRGAPHASDQSGFTVGAERGFALQDDLSSLGSTALGAHLDYLGGRLQHTPVEILPCGSVEDEAEVCIAVAQPGDELQGTSRGTSTPRCVGPHKTMR
jgi:hypothetical protein